MSLVVADVAELEARVGERIVGEWFEIDQHRIDAFAEATLDRQWIHVDPERAASGPFGSTIAHGYLTLSLLPHLTAGLVEVGGLAMAVNYGLDTVRFLAPVPAGSRVRAVVEIASVAPSSNGVRLGQSVTVELEGAERPALVAGTIALLVPAA
ncbi:MaoC family dehydratase [Agromyces seonyuensis]|uniref:Dehydratase n=1 Tax=Agromyces seonyuensis TaxID=2662446 RepID=A0A6I4P1F6_9MICO|nr:MaoC family dehydratase [Agromyces seonyuensis]MWB99372.1 dehydratase [Agromyces seonyuensis]